MAPKRKISDDGTSPPAKKSPLAGLPQNFYAPPSSNMSREQLAAWRKEQRRERNRQSAAESRNKTKLKIEQLEGEVNRYKSLCESMQAKMEMMEQQIRMLTASAEQKVEERCRRVSSEQQPATVSPTTSCPFPNQLPLFPSLLSSPADDCTPVPVPSQPDMDAAATVASLKRFPVSKEHLTISRQAVKTGALTLDPDVSEVEACVVAIPVAETVCNSACDGQESSEDDSTLDSVSVEEAVDGIVSSDEGETMEDDGDLLDLLVDTLDVEFDPNLLVA